MSLALLLAAALAPRAAAAPASQAPAIAVDPRIELFSLVYELSGPPEDPAGVAMRRNAFAYRKRMRRRFAAFAQDPAVAAFRSLQREGLDPITGLAFMTKAFDPKTAAYLPEAVPPYVSDQFNKETNAAHYRELLAFGRELPRFAARARFFDFFRESRPYYEKLEAAVRRDLQGRDVVGEFARYSGVPVDASFTIHVCPAFGDYASSIGHDTKVSIEGYLGISGEARGRPVFLYSGLERKIWQELAHAAIDDESERYPAKIEESKKLFERLPGIGHCGFWRNCVRQYSARAVGYRMLALHPRRGDDPEDRELALGGADEVTAAVADRLKEYEAARGRYASLKQFYPRMLDAFSELARDSRASR